MICANSQTRRALGWKEFWLPLYIVVEKSETFDNKAVIKSSSWRRDVLMHVTLWKGGMIHIISSNTNDFHLLEKFRVLTLGLCI
jgi:hypothetical protein